MDSSKEASLPARERQLSNRLTNAHVSAIAIKEVRSWLLSPVQLTVYIKSALTEHRLIQDAAGQ